jgi:endo-1,4-beta-mannosidase
VGVNITGILHYGETYVDESGHTKKVVEPSETGHRRQALEEARDIGARVVRVFLPHYSCRNEEVERRLREVLTQLKAVSAEMVLIPVFIDLYHNRGFFPFPKQEVDDKFFAQQGEMRRLLPKFFVPPYCPQYLSLVDHIVGKFKGETRILAWEIGNELKVDPDHTPGIGKREFVAFNHFVAERIKRLDPNHLVTTGMKSTQHPHMIDDRDLAERLYNGRRANGTRLIDFVTIHSYVDPNEPEVERRGFELDARLARALGMPIIVEETGVNRQAGDCRDNLLQHMKRWFDMPAGSDQLNAYGFMEWGFCPQGVGDGDASNCNDRNVIRDVYRSRSQMLVA